MGAVPAYTKAQELYDAAEREKREADRLYSEMYNIRLSRFERTGLNSGIQHALTEGQKKRVKELTKQRNGHMRRYKKFMAQIKWDSGQGVYVMR
jgi:hypothetical protein